MFKSALQFLSLIVLPHPELPQSYTEASHRSKWKPEEFSAVGRTTSPILVNRSAVSNMTTTPRKAPRPMSLDVSMSAAHSSAISRRRHSLCVCPEHCPPRDISPSETFWTCPAFPDSAISPLNLLGTHTNSSDNDLELTSTPIQPRSLHSHGPESPSTSTQFPHTPLFKEFRRDDSSLCPLTLSRHLRRDARVIVSTPSTSNVMLAQTSIDQPHETPPTSPLCERIGNKRHNEGSSQTHSKIFELELSPILEDSHGGDAYFGPVAGGREGSVGGTSSSYDETSDSSFGEPLQVQTVGSIKVLATRSDPNYPQIGMAPSGMDFNGCSLPSGSVLMLSRPGGSFYEPSVPALTITSPTPETLQSVVFSDSSASKVQEYDSRSRSMVPSNELLSSSGSLSPALSSSEYWGRVEARDFLTVPVKDAGRNRYSSNAKIQPEQPEREKTPILSRAWKRLSRVFALTQKAQDTEKVPFGQNRQELQPNVTRRSVSTERHDVIVAQASSGAATDADPKERPSRISALAQRRTAKRLGNFKRYSVPF